MSLTEFHGLPTHVLLVHFVVVLVPLTALALVACAVRPATARRLGAILPLLALVTLASVPLTTNAGAWLKDRLPPTARIARHADLGAGMLPWTIAVLVMALTVWWRTARGTPDGPGGAGRTSPPPRPALLRTLTALLAVAAATGSVVHVYRVGDSGAKAAWQGVVSQPTAPPRGGPPAGTPP